MDAKVIPPWKEAVSTFSNKRQKTNYTLSFKNKRLETARTDKAAQQDMHESDGSISIAHRHPR
jgi:hypothetical protein